MNTQIQYDEKTIKLYEESITYAQWQELMRLRKIECEFAKNAGYDFGYGRYWETMTLEELREATK